MPKCFKMEWHDGQIREIILPDLTEKEIRDLGWALQKVRSSCLLRQRAYQVGSMWTKEFRDQLASGDLLEVMCRKMINMTDQREEIINLPNRLWGLLIYLAYDVAQDSVNILEPFETVLKGFGLIETTPA